MTIKEFFQLPPIDNQKNLYKKFSSFNLKGKIVKAVHGWYASYFEIEDKIRDIFDEMGKEYDERYDHFPLPFDIPINLKFDRYITTDDPFIIEFYDKSTLSIFITQQGVIAEMNALKPDQLRYYTFNTSFLFRGILEKEIADINFANGKFDIFYRTPGYSEFHDFLQFSMDMFEYMTIAQMHRTPTQDYVATLRAPYWEYVFLYDEEDDDDVSVCDIVPPATPATKAVPRLAPKPKPKIIPATVSISSKVLICINLLIWGIWGLMFLVGSHFIIGFFGFVFSCISCYSIGRLLPDYEYYYQALGFLPFEIWSFWLPIVKLPSDNNFTFLIILMLNAISVLYFNSLPFAIVGDILKRKRQKTNNPL